jgi:Trk K+ transport system NAD-binding subunit
MKSLGFILSYLSTSQARRSVRVVGWMLGIFVVLVAGYSVMFHQVMEHEGQRHSWPTSVYWTVVTMSTLGYGDIAFESDVGRIFSVVVLLSGSAFILVLLPFTFIQFVFMPWMESSQRARAPRSVDPDVRGHVILTGTGAIESALTKRLRRAGIAQVTLVADVDEAVKLHDEGHSVMVGALDDPGTFVAAGAERAALLVATGTDPTNTNVVFTVQEISNAPAIVATANRHASVDILQLAGCDRVLELGEMLGSALARRVLVPDGRSHVIGDLKGLLIAEALPPTDLIGKPLRDSGLRARTGLTVAGVWERGQLHVAEPSTVLKRSSVLVLAGSRQQLDAYDDLFAVIRASPTAPVLIIGGGRVGRSAAANLVAAGLDYRLIEQDPQRIRDPQRYVLGDAADLTVLERAGIRKTSSVIITTHDDDVNVYLAIYCRRLRPDVQIIGRARLDRNVSTLHRAGADAVLSYAATGSTAIWNVLSRDNTLQIADGLDVFRVPVPHELAGKSIDESDIRDTTGCTVVATAAGEVVVPNPDPHVPLAAGTDLVLIGDDEAEHRFFDRYRSKTSR